MSKGFRSRKRIGALGGFDGFRQKQGVLSSSSFQWRWSHVVRTLLAKVIAVQDQAVLPVRKIVEALAPRGRRVLGEVFGSAGVEES
jgi:hypothetical protein